MSKFKILCIDDDKDNLSIYEMMLEEHYTVLTATNWEETLAHLKKDHSEIVHVFSDYNMPEKNGLEVRQEMLACGFEIPFAIITGHYDLAMATKGLELHISCFLEKPVEEAVLIKLIKEQVEKKESLLKEEQEMVCSFITESYQMLEEIENLILILEERPDDTTTINTYARLLHTIKGTASCVGLKSLPHFVHSYEDILSSAKERKISITPTVIDCFLYGLDRLKFMYNEISDGKNSEFDVDPWITKINEFKGEKGVEVTGEKSVAEESIESKKSQDKLAIPLETLDSFLELSGKMTITRNTIYKSMSRVELKYENDKDIEKLSSSIEELHKVTSFLQKQISEMRKVGAENITRPLKRVVRDVSKELGKDIELVIQNESIKVDNTIAKIISNCLVHLIRNSIDHGLESPEVRKKVNKKVTGTIELIFSEENDKNIVVLRDDGAGINKKRILEKAIEKNIVDAASAQLLSDEEVFALIYESGFSTATNVSSISGRGVGMDMVRSSLEAIGGKILTYSTEGKGTTFKLVLPQPKSVLINQTLMIEENLAAYSIPIEDVIEVVSMRKQDYADVIYHVTSYPVLKRHDEIIPILKLSNCLKQVKDETLDLDAMEEITTIIVKNGSHGKMGLIVEKIHEIEESVIRKVGPVLETSPIYSGVTYFGDDDLALVLNIETLTQENLQVIHHLEKETRKSATVETNIVDHNSLDIFTFAVNRNQYAIATEKVFRIEILNSSEVHSFQDSYYIKYNDNIVKIIALDSESLCKIKEKDTLAVVLMKNVNGIYALYIDEFYEFINSTYDMEIHFSKTGGVKGSIIHEDQIVYILDEAWLDKLAEKEENKEDKNTEENKIIDEKIAA